MASTATTTNTTTEAGRLAAEYGIDAEGLTVAQVLSLAYDAACEDEDEARAEEIDALIALV